VANDEHLAKLKEGAGAWNAWRKVNRDVRPDLSGANLADMDFDWYHLHATDFTRANLSESHLGGAILHDAVLTNAILISTNCEHAVFTNADFSEADLSYATFLGADLRGANFHGTTLDGTRFADVDLSETLNLDTVIHDAPSSIGIDTFFRSGGLPEGFLRGCGVPEEFITYAGSLLGKPIEYYSCFISYSSKDDEFAHRLHESLQGKKIRTWFAPEDLKIGDRFRSRIDESIRVHDKLVLILSESSINSAWVQREVETALEREDREKRDLLFPIRLDDSVFASEAAWARDVCRRHIGDFRHWKNHDDYTKSFDRLVNDLKREGPIIMKA
jgi:hypothetical protein